LIEAFKAVTVDATIDGQAKSYSLKADQVQTIKASRKVILNISDGGAVNLSVNGNDRGVPGDLGKPKRVELP
jgi:cytoskeleton protein RodZ